MNGSSASPRVADLRAWLITGVAALLLASPLSACRCSTSHPLARSIRELVSKKGFPSSLVLEPDQLVLLSALGLLRVSRTGGPITKLAEDTVALAPYSLLRAQGGEYFVYDNLAYSTTNTLFRLPRAGGAPKAFFDYQAPDPAGQSFDDNGLRDFDVDDECAYIAQWQYGKPGVQLLAQAK